MTKEETDVWRMTYCVAFASSSSERASDARGPYTSNIYHSIRAANTARRAVAGLNGLLHDEDPEHRAAAAAVLGTDGGAL